MTSNTTPSGMLRQLGFRPRSLIHGAASLWSDIWVVYSFSMSQASQQRKPWKTPVFLCPSQGRFLVVARRATVSLATPGAHGAAVNRKPLCLPCSLPPGRARRTHGPAWPASGAFELSRKAASADALVADALPGLRCAGVGP